MEQSGSSKAKPDITESRPIEKPEIIKTESDLKPQENTVHVNGKGKGKAPEMVIDWSDWKPQTYTPRHMAELRFK